MSIFTEELIEPIVRFLRFEEGLKEIDKKKEITLVDLGCGPQIRFFNYTKNKLKIKKYLGIDPLISKTIISKYSSNKKIKILKNKNIPLPDNFADYTVGFAFIEHVENPKEIIKEAIRITKKNGKIIFTSPTPKAKGILEFFSYKLNLLSKREIKEHKNYFNKNSFRQLIPDKIKVGYKHKYFEMGLNNLFVLKK